MKNTTRKKALVALGALAVAGVASAQSSVTLFGVIDARLMHGRSDDGGHLNQLGSGGTTSSRFGLRGVEDLGGGLNASFWMEANFAADTGIGTASNTNNQTSGFPPAAALASQGVGFNYRSTVSLAGNWGEVRAGRDFTPQWRNIAANDPWGQNGASFAVIGPATSQGLGIVPGTTSTAIRASNQISYYLPANLSGFYGQASAWLGENASTAANHEDGTGYGLRAGWGNGPVDIAVAWARTQYLTGDARQMNIGGSWNFGVARLMGIVVRDELGSTDGKGWEIAASAPIGVWELRAAYSHYKVNSEALATDPTATKLALGVMYNFSKRTALYGVWSDVHNKNGARVTVNGAPTIGPNRNASGVDLGIRHFF